MLEKEHGNRITNMARYDDTLFALSAPTPPPEKSPQGECSRKVQALPVPARCSA